jgi:hypothetical protein
LSNVLQMPESYEWLRIKLDPVALNAARSRPAWLGGYGGQDIQRPVSEGGQDLIDWPVGQDPVEKLVVYDGPGRWPVGHDGPGRLKFEWKPAFTPQPYPPKKGDEKKTTRGTFRDPRLKGICTASQPAWLGGYGGQDIQRPVSEGGKNPFEIEYYVPEPVDERLEPYVQLPLFTPSSPRDPRWTRWWKRDSSSETTPRERIEAKRASKNAMKGICTAHNVLG